MTTFVNNIIIAPFLSVLSPLSLPSLSTLSSLSPSLFTLSSLSSLSLFTLSPPLYSLSSLFSPSLSSPSLPPLSSLSLLLLSSSRLFPTKMVAYCYYIVRQFNCVWYHNTNYCESYLYDIGKPLPICPSPFIIIVSNRITRR